MAKQTLQAYFTDSAGAKCRVRMMIEVEVKPVQLLPGFEAAAIQSAGDTVSLDQIPLVGERAAAVQPFLDTIAEDQPGVEMDAEEKALLKQQNDLLRQQIAAQAAQQVADAPKSMLIAAPGRQLFAYSTWVLVVTALVDVGYVVLPLLTENQLMSAQSLAYFNVGMAALAQVAKMLKQTIPVTSDQKADLVASAAALPMKPGERNVTVHVGGEVVASTPQKG